MKTFLAISILALSSLTVASAKSYDIMISNPTKVGSVQLKPGSYKLTIKGSDAVFTDVNSAKSYTTPVKVQSTDQKFDQTRVQSTKDGDQDRIKEIDLGGSKTKVDFGL